MYYNIGMALGWSNQNNLVLSVLYQDNHQIYNRLKQTYMINKEDIIARQLSMNKSYTYPIAFKHG